LRALQGLDGLELVEVRQTVTVGAADVEVSDMLELPLNAPVAFVYRTAVDAPSSSSVTACTAATSSGSTSPCRCRRTRIRP
jgi:hypothetical protein